MLVLTTFQKVSPTSLLKIKMNNDNINEHGKLDLPKPTMSQSYTKNSRLLRKIMSKRGDLHNGRAHQLAVQCQSFV